MSGCADSSHFGASSDLSVVPVQERFRLMVVADWIRHCSNLMGSAILRLTSEKFRIIGINNLVRTKSAHAFFWTPVTNSRSDSASRKQVGDTFLGEVWTDECNRDFRTPLRQRNTATDIGSLGCVGRA